MAFVFVEFLGVAIGPEQISRDSFHADQKPGLRRADQNPVPKGNRASQRVAVGIDVRSVIGECDSLFPNQLAGFGIERNQVDLSPAFGHGVQAVIHRQRRPAEEMPRQSWFRGRLGAHSAHAPKRLGLIRGFRMYRQVRSVCCTSVGSIGRRTMRSRRIEHHFIHGVDALAIARKQAHDRVFRIGGLGLNVVAGSGRSDAIGSMLGIQIRPSPTEAKTGSDNSTCKAPDVLSTQRMPSKVPE